MRHLTARADKCANTRQPFTQPNPTPVKRKDSTMPENGNTGHKGSALLTISLLEHSTTPDELSDAILETLIELSGENRVNIWHAELGLSEDSLAALYSMYETGAGYRRMRLYGAYEAGRKYRRRRRRK